MVRLRYHDIIRKPSIPEKVYPFNKAIHEITRKMKYETPVMFFEEVNNAIEEERYSITNKQ